MIDADWIERRLGKEYGERSALARAMGLTSDKLSKILSGERRLQINEATLAKEYFDQQAADKGAADIAQEAKAIRRGMSEPAAPLPLRSNEAVDPRGAASALGHNDIRVSIADGHLIVNAAVDKSGIEALKKMIAVYEDLLE